MKKTVVIIVVIIAVLLLGLLLISSQRADDMEVRGNDEINRVQDATGAISVTTLGESASAADPVSNVIAETVENNLDILNLMI